MAQTLGPYHVVDIPAPRRPTPRLLDVYWSKHTIFGLLEVDVTVPRRIIDDHKTRTGEALSFTGFLVFCLARAVDEDKSVQAYPKGRRQLVIYEDVDVAIAVEREMAGTRAPVGHVIRRANGKSYLDIHREIRAVQSGAPPRSTGLPPLLQFGLSLPGPLGGFFASLLSAVVRYRPAISVAAGGTVAVTAVGMFGRRGGWGLVPFPHPLGLVVCGISEKPAVVDGRIEAREFLSLTVALDHDVVDGAPAARFMRRLAELIESGEGLREVDAEDNGPAATQPAVDAG
jgi:hypothetical protein